MSSLANIETNQNQSIESPFDSIRHFDEHGNEFWYARELMTVLGYQKWSRFSDVIERTKISFSINPMGDIDSHVAAFEKMVKRSQGGGYNLPDFKLSRYFCYLIAMNGDVRKPEIATAQSYFAVKTREAETVVPEISERLQLALLENENLKMQVQISNNNRYVLDKSEAIATLHGAGLLALIKGVPEAVVEVKEKVTETIVIENGRQATFEGKSTAQMAKELGFKSGTQLESWLRKNESDHLICQGFRKVQVPYIPTENVKEIRKIWSQNKNRQLLIGE